jgi:hypothetical protein
MKNFRMLYLILLCILILVNGIIWFTWSSLEKTLLNPVYYDHMLNNSDLIPFVHERIHFELPGILEENLPESILLEYDLLIKSRAETEDIQSSENLKSIFDIYADALSQAFNAGWLRDQALDSVETIFQYIDSHTGELDLSIDFTQNLRLLRQYIADGLKMNLQLQDEQPDESIELYVESMLVASAIPDRYNLADSIISADIAQEVDAFVSALRSFRRIILYWPLATYVLIIITMIGLTGTERALIFSGATTLLLSLFFGAILIVGRIFISGLMFIRQKILFDSLSAPLVEIFEFAGLQAISLIAPLLYWISLAGLFPLILGLVFKLRLSKTI